MQALDLTDEQLAAFEYELHRRRLKSDFTYFAEYALKQKNDDYSLSHSHKLLCAKLQDVADGKIKKFMALCPSGWGKSTILSVFFPAWLMARQPGIQLIGASHTTDFAMKKISKPIQETITDLSKELGVKLGTDNKADWWLDNKSTYRAAGAGAGILGERAHGIIIDDPISGVAQAKSVGEMDKLYEWYRGDVQSRLHKGDNWQILMHQRLSNLDLVARLLAEEPDEWDILFLPARFTGKDVFGKPVDIDQMGRTEIGQSVYPEVWTDEVLTQVEKDAGPYSWASMYQQSPAPIGGELFRVGQFFFVENPDDIMPAAKIVRKWDLAATSNGDWTAGVLMQRDLSGRYTILDVVRRRGTPDVIHQLILETAQTDRAKYGPGVEIVIPTDPGAAGLFATQAIIQRLAGFRIVGKRETGDKETRAQPFAAQVNAGNVSIVRAKWNRTFLDEMATFPDSRYDDQVDAASGAFEHLLPPRLVYRRPTFSHGSHMAR